jgi:hypothetical protein
MVRRDQHPPQQTHRTLTVRPGPTRKPMMAVPRGQRPKTVKEVAEPNPFLEAALEYARRGWAVFPLAPHSKETIKGSNGHNDAATTEKAIRRWWSD